MGKCNGLLFLLLCVTSVLGDFSSVQDSRLESLEHAVEQVLEENKALTIKLVQLQTELSIQEQQKLQLSEKVSELEHLIQVKHQQLDVLEATVKITETEVDNEKEESWSVRKRQLNSAWVGFTAVISPSDISNLKPGQPIIFDQIITNMGASYNESTGKFTAPTKGTYVFNMDILVEQGENEYLQFVKDGNHVMYNFAHAQGSLHDASSSRLVVLSLNKGNQVWVQTAPNSHHGSGTIHGNGFSTFSGWLQQLIEEPPAVVGK